MIHIQGMGKRNACIHGDTFPVCSVMYRHQPILVSMAEHSIHQVAPFYHPVTEVKRLSVDTETARPDGGAGAVPAMRGQAKSSELPAPTGYSAAPVGHPPLCTPG